MRKPLIAALAALTFAGAAVATAVPASAAPFHGGYGWHGGYYRGYGAGPVVAAGIAGLAVGAALAGPGYGYGPPPPAYYGPYGTCFTQQRVWDPYYGRYIFRSVPYAC